MKILLFGGRGQLGREIIPRAQQLNFQISSPISTEVDINDEEQVKYLVNKINPNVVINSAAYTAVDKAESESELAFAVNALGSKIVAEASYAVKAKYVYVSTDYVFDGAGKFPLGEEDKVNPQSVYGKSKLEGENLAFQATNSEAIIIRTSSLHGVYGNNFVHSIKKVLEEKKQATVVDDQFMSPTWAGWLAEVILDISRLQVSGVFHASCSGETSWFDFAKAIRDIAVPGAEVLPMSFKDLDRPAKRPQYSVFNTSKLEKLLGKKPLDWKKGLKNHLTDLENI